MSTLLSKFARKKAAEPLDEPIAFDQETFSRPGQNGFTARWADIRRIVGYKIDLLTVDEIRVDFELKTNVTVIVTEESPGFGAFMSEVERRFPSVEGWFAKIAQPPFAPVNAVLYQAEAYDS